jgi:GTP-binding protein HflX
VVIVNHELSPAQERNLEQFIGCRVVDRIGLILDIFAQRASSFEGKLQVELAQLSRLSSRLVRGWTHLERQKGGIGLRGPGETQLESDRRLIGARIKQINRRLSRVAKQRDLSRRARRKASVAVVSIVGYTNAGKSTLFNRITGANAQTANQLFATLDPTLRRLPLSGGQSIIVADTVGFIRHLPHDLVAAFRATLEETRNASVLLHVIDSTCPGRTMRVEQVNTVLAEIGAAAIPQIEIYNKIDLDPQLRPGLERGPEGQVRRVLMSAHSGEGVSMLLQALSEHCAPKTVHRQLCLPPSAGRLRARLYELGAVLAEQQEADGAWVLEVEIPRQSLERLCRSEGLDQSCIAA